jgi:nucleotide-binding universal stress UspA family protein
MRRIVAAVDFSTESIEAAAEAAGLAVRLDAQLLLVHACESVGARDGTAARAIAAEHAVAAERGLAALEKRLARPGLHVAGALVSGEPSAAIAEYAAWRSAYLLVLGTHGRTGFRRLLMGSVAEKTLRGARTDVLVARPRTRGEERPHAGLHVLVATDFSPSADAAVARATELVAHESVLEIMHVLPPPVVALGRPADVDAGADELGSWRAELREAAQRRVDALAAGSRASGARVLTSIVEGTAVAEILRRLDVGAYDLVVLGRGAAPPGSVAAAIVRHAPCSVLAVTVPAPAAGGA